MSKLGNEIKFTPSVQEQIFRNYLVDVKRPLIKSYITGSTENIISAQLALAQEFASVSSPYTGNSYYAGGGGTALISAQQTAEALRDERASYQQMLAKGKSRIRRGTLSLPGSASNFKYSLKRTPRLVLRHSDYDSLA